MIHRYAFEAVNRTFRDLTNVNKIFGGKIIILGGDFRQTLPVVVRGTQAQIVDACLKSSILWKNIQNMQLTINMRIQQQDDAEQKKFMDFLLRIGEGEEQVHYDIDEDIIRLPNNIVFDNENIEELISKIFYDINSNYQNKNYIRDRVILTTKN